MKPAQIRIDDVDGKIKEKKNINREQQFFTTGKWEHPCFTLHQPNNLSVSTCAMHVCYYISQLVRVLWLVNLTGRISLYAPLNSKVCLNWNLPLSIWTKRYNEYIANIVFFGVRAVSYGTSFFRSIYSPRVSRLGLKSERKNLGRDLQHVLRSRLLIGRYWQFIYELNSALEWVLR